MVCCLNHFGQSNKLCKLLWTNEINERNSSVKAQTLTWTSLRELQTIAMNCVHSRKSGGSNQPVKAEMPVTVLDVIAMGPSSNDSAPPREPPESAAGAEAAAPAPPIRTSHSLPFNSTYTGIARWQGFCLLASLQVSVRPLNKMLHR